MSDGENPDWQVLILDRYGKEVARIKVDEESRDAIDRPGVRCVNFNAAGDCLLLATDKSVRIHAMTRACPSPKPIAEFRVPMRHLHAACFVGKERLAVTTAEGEIVLFSLDNPKPIRIWQSTKLQARLLLATPDGKLLLTANGNEPYGPESAVSKTIRVWKVDV
jgi:WD40 repeat protein